MLRKAKVHAPSPGVRHRRVGGFLPVAEVGDACVGVRSVQARTCVGLYHKSESSRMKSESLALARRIRVTTIEFRKPLGTLAVRGHAVSGSKGDVASWMVVLSTGSLVNRCRRAVRDFGGIFRCRC